MAWTNISKPSANSWTRTNPQGREQYDDPSVSYDDSGVFYDGVNQSAWTNLSKPSSLTWAQCTFTWASTNRKWGSINFTAVNKPT